MRTSYLGAHALPPEFAYHGVRPAALVERLAALVQRARERAGGTPAWLGLVYPCDGLALQWLIDPARSPRPDDLLRGMVVARPDTLHATTLVDVRLRLLARWKTHWKENPVAR